MAPDGFGTSRRCSSPGMETRRKEGASSNIGTGSSNLAREAGRSANPKDAGSSLRDTGTPGKTCTPTEGRQQSPANRWPMSHPRP
jgi:hypothetical protein